MAPRADVPLVSLDDIREAARRLRGVARTTPLWPASGDDTWWPLRLKCENLQVAGSFKLRGAYTMMSRLLPEALRAGVITYSSGNHGQAVAYAARALGTSAVIVMPTTAPAIKVTGARRFGAEVVFAGTTTLERKARAEDLQRERSLTMVPPFDHPDIIAGQGTVGLEIADEAPAVSAVFVPVGGGGLLSGVAAALRRLVPGVRIVGCEPEGAAKMTRSLAAGAPVTLERVETIADGLMAVRPGDLTFAHVVALVDEIVTVTDRELAEAVAALAREAKLVVEPSGAAGVAAARRQAAGARGGTPVAVVSGGNVEPERLAGLLESAARARGGDHR